MKPDVERIPLDRITLDPRLQMRAGGTSETLAAEYAEVLDDLPPSKVVGDGETFWLTEGWHRHRAHQIAGCPDMPCQVRRGTFLDALIEAAASNHAHGLPRTSEDKRKAVRTLLAENEANRHGWSNRHVARMARVGHTLVAEVLSETPPGGIGISSNSSGPGGNNGEPSDATSPPPATTSDDEDPEDGKPPPEPLDEDGTPLPPQAVAAFDLLPEVRSICRSLDDAGRELERMGKSPAGVHMHWQSARSQLRSARQTLWQGRPAYVCPVCRGLASDCQVCRGAGFVAAATYNSWKRSEEFREGKS
jgi:hypothetical protein